jgi:plasmid stabilization system protein ParE
MAFTIIYKKRFVNKLVKVLDYLEKEWGGKVATAFLSTLDERINMLNKYPEIGKASAKLPSIRSILISKHNKLYYKIDREFIVILNMYDMRMNPKRNLYE